MMAAVWRTRAIFHRRSDWGIGRSPYDCCGFAAAEKAVAPMHRPAAANTIYAMHEILIATDGSAAAGAALEEALTLALQTGSGVAAITVWRALQGDFGLAYPSTAVLSDILEAERTHAETTLSAAVQRAEETGVPMITRLATGDPAEMICAYADEIEARLVAIGTRGHSTVAALLLGGVSHAVVRGAPCPVLVVRGPRPTREHAATTRAAAGGSALE